MAAFESKILHLFRDSGISFTDELLAELSEIISGNGLHDRFVPLLRRRLKYLRENPSDFWERSDWFEPIDVKVGIYAIRFLGWVKNPRILFTIRGQQIIILLVAFEENKGRAANRDLYQRAIEKAINRLNDWKEE